MSIRVMSGWSAVALLCLMSSKAACEKRRASVRGNPAEWFNADSYPAAAIRDHKQGRVVAVLAIDSTGAVSACSIKQSSGSADLDNATCSLALERGHFEPATDRKGRPVAAEYVLPVRWVLPDEPATVDAGQVPLKVSTAFEYFVSSEGIVASCRVIDATPPTLGIDPCRSVTIGGREQIMQHGGKAVSYRVVRRMSQDIVLGE